LFGEISHQKEALVTSTKALGGRKNGSLSPHYEEKLFEVAIFRQ
jgi:hypothetical protein